MYKCVIYVTKREEWEMITCKYCSVELKELPKEVLIYEDLPKNTTIMYCEICETRFIVENKKIIDELEEDEE